ncbi:MAG: peroxidase family protein [Steroidobacteraceae bacterium]
MAALVLDLRRNPSLISHVAILRLVVVAELKDEDPRPSSRFVTARGCPVENFNTAIRSAVLGLIVMANSSLLFAQTSPVVLLPEFRPVGGGGNNLHNPQLNATPGAAEINLAPLNFVRGTANGPVTGPNARLISNMIAGSTGANGQDSDSTDPVASAWLYVFGQFVDHDLDLESAPLSSEAINIPVLLGDPAFPAGTTIPMTRDARNPSTNTIVNTVAGYLDLSQLYGVTADGAASLRNPDGTLKTEAGGEDLPIVNGAFIAGDPRVMENPELSVVTILFMREHNRWVQQLRAQQPGWSGDQLYNMAKSITTAEYQNVVYGEYLPVLIGNVLGSYRGYDDRVNAQVTQEFSTAAFRVGHSQVSETQEGVDNNGNTLFAESLAQAFFNTATDDEANGINPLLRAIGLDSSQATDVYTVPVLRNLLSAGLVGGGIDLIDLIAIDIQRERDVGLGSLNQTRRAIGLSPYSSFSQLTSDTVLQQNLQIVYGNIDAVDLFIGGLAENHARGAAVGPTLQAIIAKQFDALRNGDRFFWQNQKFDRATAATIARTTLGDIIKRNTDTTTIATHVFLVPGTPVHRKPTVPGAPGRNHGHRQDQFIVR